VRLWFIFRNGHEQLLVYPHFSGTGKATNFKFCMHILNIDRNKSPLGLQISGKVAVGVVRTLEIFQGTHILGASRGCLCDSSAFLLATSLPISQLSVQYSTWLWSVHVYIVGWSLLLQSFVCWCWISSSVSAVIVSYHYILFTESITHHPSRYSVSFPFLRFPCIHFPLQSGQFRRTLFPRSYKSSWERDGTGGK